MVLSLLMPHNLIFQGTFWDGTWTRSDRLSHRNWILWL